MFPQVCDLRDQKTNQQFKLNQTLIKYKRYLSEIRQKVLITRNYIDLSHTLNRKQTVFLEYYCSACLHN